MAVKLFSRSSRCLSRMTLKAASRSEISRAISAAACMGLIIKWAAAIFTAYWFRKWLCSADCSGQRSAARCFFNAILRRRGLRLALR